MLANVQGKASQMNSACVWIGLDAAIAKRRHDGDLLGARCIFPYALYRAGTKSMYHENLVG